MAVLRDISLIYVVALHKVCFFMAWKLFYFTLIFILLLQYLGLNKNIMSSPYLWFFNWSLRSLRQKYTALNRYWRWCKCWHDQKYYIPLSVWLDCSERIKSPWLVNAILLFNGILDTWGYFIHNVRFWPLYFYNFLFLAFLPIYVTYILFVFLFRTYLNLDLTTPIRKPLPSASRLVLLVAEKFSQFYTYSSVSAQGRINLWRLFLENVSDNFFFLKRYYRLNDLIWQDGFLIDFLQKKVVDKWVRTFVIHSGYLFSERFLFDIVVRFYIDFIIWPLYSYSLYEFNNVASTLTLTLVILMKLFLIVSIYYMTLLL